MSRLVVVESLQSAVSARHEWDVVLDAEHPERGLDPAVLLEQVGVVAATLARDAVGAPVFAVAVEQLEVLAAVAAGERLIVTAALERPTDGRVPVSLVVRRRRGKPGAVVIVGVLHFAAAQRLEVPRAVNDQAVTGHAPMQTTFRARAWGDDPVLTGNVVPWVHASALVSAQGFAGAPVSLSALESLSVLGPIGRDEPLTLSCSVVKASPSHLTVLSLVKGRGDRDVLSALSTFKLKR